MLKKFFISMLGTIAGIWIASILAVLVGLFVIGAIFSSGTKSSASVEDGSVLYLDLSGEILERRQSGDVWAMIQGNMSESETLDNITAAVRRAADDDKIEGIYINANGSAAGMATREEIINAMRDFKKSGKWVIAYGDFYEQGDYVLSSLADEVYLNPVGHVNVHGVASEIPFYKELMDKLGVKAQIIRVGTYKSAVEPFMGTEMSPASRLQTEAIVDTLWTYNTDVITAERKVELSQVNVWTDSIMFTLAPEEVLDAKAVSALKYRREVENLIREKCGLDEDEDLPFVTPSEYMANVNTVTPSQDHIAVYYACGDIVDSGEGGIVGSTVTPDIISLADDDNVKALVLRVNSGGGSAFASEQIWEALEYFKSKGKPFYVSMGDYAASGGYYISCGADKIFADRTTLTGSIGVFGMIPDISGLVTDKLGIHFSTVESGDNAGFPSILRPMTPQQAQAMQRNVEICYDKFTSRVAEGRNMSQDSVKVIGQGRVWTAGAALKIGLVDRIGDLHAAVKAIAAECDLDTDDVVAYPAVEPDMLAELILQAKNGVKVSNVKIDPYTVKVMRTVEYLRSMNPVQARMEPMQFQ